MALSKIDLNEAGRLRSTIIANKDESFAMVSAYLRSAESMLSEFEAKLAVLEREKERAYQALCQCELHKNDDEENPKSCAAEESAYQHAAARYERCLSLVNQARSAISEFRSRAARNRETIDGIVSRSEQAMNQINEVLHRYLSNTDPTLGGGDIEGQMHSGNFDHNGHNGDYDGGSHGGDSNGGHGADGSHSADGSGNGSHGDGSQGGSGGDGNGGHGTDARGDAPGVDSQGSSEGFGEQRADANNASGAPGYFDSGNGTGDFGPISPDAATMNAGASGGTMAAGIGAATLGAGLGIGAGAYFMNKKDEGNKDDKKEKDELHFTYVNDDYSSSPDFDMFNPIWEMERKTKNLPYETVDDYLKHELSEANKIIDNLRSVSNLSDEEMLDKLEKRKTEINQSLNNCISSYDKQINLLEKNYQLAQYKVEYQNLKMMEYKEKNTLNPDPYGGDRREMDGTRLANIIPFPWAKEYREKYGDFGGGWYPKEMERREKELIEKYGISENDIKTMKFVVDNDKTIANIASATNDIHKGAKSASNMVLSNENDRKLINSGIDNVNDSMPLAVAAEDYYKAKTYESERDSILETKAKIEADYANARQNLEKQKEQLECLSNLIHTTNTDNLGSLNSHDKLSLANKMGSDIECVREVPAVNNSKKMEGYDSLTSRNN